MTRFEAALVFVRIWAEKHPELKGRLERAVFMLDRIEKTACPDIYTVRSEANFKVKYVVRVYRKTRVSTCSCADSGKGNHCKHRLAVALYEKTR